MFIAWTLLFTRPGLLCGLEKPAAAATATWRAADAAALTSAARAATVSRTLFILRASRVGVCVGIVVGMYARTFGVCVLRKNVCKCLHVRVYVCTGT
jgi:hypothetical protein